MRVSLDKKLNHLEPISLFRWISLIAATAMAVLLGSFFVYWIYFGGRQISRTPQDWGPFKDFIGGITNPIISLFALLAVLLTLMVQSTQSQATREELDNLKKEAKKSDIYRTLQVLENRLNLFSVRRYRLEESELYLLLSHATDGVLKKIPPLTNLRPPGCRNEYLGTKATLTQLHITLVKLSTQLTSFVCR